jgi:hypothetical protein
MMPVKMLAATMGYVVVQVGLIIMLLNKMVDLEFTYRLNEGLALAIFLPVIGLWLFQVIYFLQKLISRFIP